MEVFALSDRDAGAVLSLVGEINRAETVDEYADVTMQGMVELIPCIDASYNEMNLSARRISFRAFPDPGDLLEHFQPVFARLMHQNPLVQHFHESGDTRAMMWSDFMTVDEIRNTELHREMFQSLGVDSQMAVTLPAPPGVVVGFAVNTGPDGFTERDRTVFNTLRPHLGHAYRVIQLRDELSTAQSELRSRGWTGVLADERGTVQAVTDDADELESNTGISLSNGEPLPEPLNTVFTGGVSAYRSSQPAVRSRPVRLSEEADGVAAWHVPGPVAPHIAMVKTGVDTAGRRLREAGLSPREIEVATELTEGGTNAAIANRLGIAEGTVRKHLERIYRALGVADRASAIATILGV